jgi:hypothetical protein
VKNAEHDHVGPNDAGHFLVDVNVSNRLVGGRVHNLEVIEPLSELPVLDLFLAQLVGVLVDRFAAYSRSGRLHRVAGQRSHLVSVEEWSVVKLKCESMECDAPRSTIARRMSVSVRNRCHWKKLKRAREGECERVEVGDDQFFCDLIEKNLNRKKADFVLRRRIVVSRCTN